MVDNGWLPSGTLSIAEKSQPIRSDLEMVERVLDDDSIGFHSNV